MSSINPQRLEQMDSELAASINRLAEKIGSEFRATRRTCVLCQYFSVQNGEVCMIATPPVRPPAEIIAFGCAAFSPDDIPF